MNTYDSDDNHHQHRDDIHHQHRDDTHHQHRDETQDMTEGAMVRFSPPPTSHSSQEKFISSSCRRNGEPVDLTNNLVKTNILKKLSSKKSPSKLKKEDLVLLVEDLKKKFFI